MKLRVIELFAGIGSQTQALKNLGIEHEVVAISEIDKHAIRSYEAIHGPVNNLGDITKIEQLPECDLLTYSFPCQDLSIAGHGVGMKKGTGTRSGLLWEVERLLNCSPLPKYLLMENVPQVIGSKNKRDFNQWVNASAEMGYTSYYDILNAKDFRIPQHRERCFMVSTLDKSVFTFPEHLSQTMCLRDILQENVPEKYFISPEKSKRLLNSFNDFKSRTFNTCNNIQSLGVLQDFGYTAENKVYSINGISPTVTSGGANSRLKIVIPCLTPGRINKRQNDPRFKSDGEPMFTLTTQDQHGVLVMNDVCGLRVRKLTPLECWRLMGFSDNAFYAAQAAGVSETQLYRQAGNSIVVDVLMAIFEELYLTDSKKHKQTTLISMEDN